LDELDREKRGEPAGKFDFDFGTRPLHSAL
jgi:hypothetical protein